MTIPIRKSTKKSIKLSVAYEKLAEALETEKITGKNYRAIQKYLMVLKRKNFVHIKCNSKKHVLIAEAKRVLARRVEIELRNANFAAYEAMVAA